MRTGRCGSLSVQAAELLVTFLLATTRNELPFSLIKMTKRCLGAPGITKQAQRRLLMNDRQTDVSACAVSVDPRLVSRDGRLCIRCNTCGTIVGVVASWHEAITRFGVSAVCGGYSARQSNHPSVPAPLPTRPRLPRRCPAHLRGRGRRIGQEWYALCYPRHEGHILALPFGNYRVL